MADVRFYLDENVEVVIADQLQRHGLEVVTTRGLETLGDTDANHLERAKRMGYVFCTYDSDFLTLAWETPDHAGIAYAKQENIAIGDWVSYLLYIHGKYSAEEMQNRVEYVKKRGMY